MPIKVSGEVIIPASMEEFCVHVYERYTQANGLRRVRHSFSQSESDFINTYKIQYSADNGKTWGPEENVYESDLLHHAEALVGSHHEKWDGTGYPFNLKGDGIPLQGRLMAIIDVYDALTNDRPYKKAFTHQESMEIIKKGAGSHFDPQLSEIFLRYSGDFTVLNS